MTPEQFHADPKASSRNFNLLNVNIRSLSNNFDKLKECVKALNCDFNVIGISETHLKEKPHNYYNIPGFTINTPIETIGKRVVFVYMFISDQVKNKLRGMVKNLRLLRRAGNNGSPWALAVMCDNIYSDICMIIHASTL